jgi:hypothetical protein
MDLLSKLLQISKLQMLHGNVRVSPSQFRAVWVCSSQYARWVTHGPHDHPARRSTNLDEQSLNWIIIIFHWVHVHLLTTMISTMTFFWSLVLFIFFF